MNIRQTGIGLALVAAGSLAVLWIPGIPLGVPGEWVWSRIPVAPGEWTLLVLGVVSALIVGGLYFGLVALGASRLERAGRLESLGWPAALVAAAFAWLWALQESPAAPQYALGKSGWVLYYHAHEGYFEQARYVVRDVPSFLAGYEKEMSRGDYLHLGTHPPGLILFHRACFNLCSGSRGLVDLLTQTEPTSFHDAMEVTKQSESAGRQPVTSTEIAALWLAALITQALAAATVVPLYLLVRRTNSPTTSWWTAALWPLVPALAVFLPKSDAMLPFFGALFLWLWLEGFRTGRLLWCALAGVIFWLGMFLSLAILPVALAAALLTIWESIVCRHEERTRLRSRDWAVRIAAAAIGWGVPVLLLWLFARINLFAVWHWNYRNHAAFYEHSQQFPRTYWKWLVANAVELAFAVGCPMIVAAAIGFRRVFATGWRRRAMGPYWCLTATWLLLWLSGKNMGEAARLWLLFMPWPVWLAASYFAAGSQTVGDEPPRPWRAAALLFVIQMVVAIGTVTRVTGFDFPVTPDAHAVAIRESLPVSLLASAGPNTIRTTPD
jgi:methylthioxylose transferase